MAETYTEKQVQEIVSFSLAAYDYLNGRPVGDDRVELPSDWAEELSLGMSLALIKAGALGN